MFVKPSSAFVGKPSVVASSSGSAKYARYARLLPSTRKSSESRAGASSRSSSMPVSVFGLTDPTLSSAAMLRVPLLSGTRLVLASAPEDAIVLRPPRPAGAVADVAAAVRDALRFPLEGDSLESHVGRGTRATIVVEPPALPIPGSPNDPRALAVTAVVDELERLGISTGYQTFLVASGLSRRTSQRELEGLVTPELARRFATSTGPCRRYCAGTSSVRFAPICRSLPRSADRRRLRMRRRCSGRFSCVTPSSTSRSTRS